MFYQEATSYGKNLKLKLKTDAQFRMKEIQGVLDQMLTDTYALPEGHIEYQSYLYKKDIKAAVDSASGTGTLQQIFPD